MGSLRELLRAGIRVGQAANHLNISVATAWRMVTVDKSAQEALAAGDELKRMRMRSKLEARADEMLDVVASLARDEDVEDAVRLKAAQDILDRSGLLPKEAKQKPGQVQAGTVIELASIDEEFHSRLQRITVKAGASS